MATKTKAKNLSVRPPIVTIMGHVDHGKTSLLDKIRESSIAAKETGAITQHTSAYQVTVSAKEGPRKITFIDTPGHAAFWAMRSRGGRIADLVILVIAADDGVKQQTIEAIQHTQSAKVPVIVAINKCDLATADGEKVKEQLAREGLALEGWGGKTPAVNISAKTGEGIAELLETILLTTDLMELQANPNGEVAAVVVEAHKDIKRGPIAAVIVKSGTLSIGDELFVNNQACRIKALFDDWGKPITKVLPGDPAEILGLKAIPEAGEILSSEPVAENKKQSPNTPPTVKEGVNILPLYIKADTKGTLEAVIANLESLPNDTSSVSIVGSGVGDIGEGDLLLSSSTKATIIGFNVKIPGSVAEMAKQLKVPIRLYELIYLLLEDVERLLKGLVLEEKYLGKGLGMIIQIFSLPSGDRVAGVFITHGNFKEKDKVHILRGGEEIAKDVIKQLKHGKDRVKKISAGTECGIMFRGKIDLQIEDVVEVV